MRTYSKSNSNPIRLNRVIRYRWHTVAHRFHRFGMHRRSLIAVVPNTSKPSCFAFGVRWPIWTERIPSVQRKQQMSSMHQIVQCPFRSRIPSCWCSPWLEWYFAQLRFHNCKKGQVKSISCEIQIFASTYDGNLCVISLHQLIKPNVIIIAAAKVIKDDVIPNKTSRKSPKNEASNCLSVNRLILQ